MDLADEVITVAEGFPVREQFILTQQLCKAAYSVPSNIAEGRGRGTRKDFAHFVRQARGSVYEIETQLSMALRRKYITAAVEKDLLVKSARVLQLINGLIRRLSDPRPPTRDLP